MLLNAWNEPQKTRENWDEEKFGPNVELEGDPKWDFGNLMYHRVMNKKQQRQKAQLNKFQNLKKVSDAIDNLKQKKIWNKREHRHLFQKKERMLRM